MSSDGVRRIFTGRGEVIQHGVGARTCSTCGLRWHSHERYVKHRREDHEYPRPARYGRVP